MNITDILEARLSGKLKCVELSPSMDEIKQWKLGNRGRATEMFKSRLINKLVNAELRLK